MSGVGQRRWRAVRGALVWLVGATAALLWLTPLLVMIVGSLKPESKVLPEAGSWLALVPREASFDNYVDAWHRVRFGRFLANSVWINGLIVGLGLVVNALAGYALARLRWPGRRWVFAGVLALLVIPFEAIAVPLFYQLSVLGWRDSYLVQALPFVANPLSIYLFHAFFRELPREFEEAARLDGANALQIFWMIIVPNAKPAFATVTIVTFLTYWGMYLWPLLMTTSADVRPLPLAIATFQTLPPVQWGDILAFGAMMVAPVLLVFLVFQRWFVRGVASSGVVG